MFESATLTPPAERLSCSSERTRISRGTIGAICLASAFVVYIYATQSRYGQIRHHGDYWSDMRVSVVADNLNRSGFRNMRLSMPLDRGQAYGLRPNLYINHPSFDVLALALGKRLGLTEDQFRMFPLIVSGSAIVAAFLLFRDVLGEGVALLAVAAMTVSAPFRLLSDGFCYQAYCVAIQCWAFLAITRAATAPRALLGRRLALCTIAAGAAMAFVDFEALPAIGIFSVLFPLCLTPGAIRPRVGIAFRVAASVSIGFLLGGALLVSHAAWALDDFRSVFSRYASNYQWRASTDYAQIYWSRSFPIEMIYRLWTYYNVQLTVAFAGLFAVGMTSIRRRGLVLLTVIFAAGVAWPLLLRQHSHQHVHTVFHFTLTISLLLALVLEAVWIAVRSKSARVALATVACAAAVLALSDRTLQAYGNVLKSFDYADRERAVQEVVQALPQNSAVVVQNPGADSSIQYYLQRDYIDRSTALSEILPDDLHPYLVTTRFAANESAGKALSRYLLVASAADLLLFDLRRGPGVLNAMRSDRTCGLYRASGRQVEAFAMHPLIPAIPDQFARTFTVAAGPCAKVSLYASFADLNAGRGDGVSLHVRCGGAAGRSTLLHEQFIPSRRPSEWVPMSFVVPARTAPTKIEVDVDCGPGGNCDFDWVYVGIGREEDCTPGRPSTTAGPP